MCAKYTSRGGKTFIDDEDKLIDYLVKGAKGFTTAIARDTAKRLKKNTAELVYKDYKPKMYNRTMEMLNSIVGPGFNGGTPTRKTIDGFEAEVGFDLDRITPYPPTKTEWGKHSTWDGEPYIGELIEGFEERGFTLYGGKNLSHIIYEREPVHMIETTIEEVESALNGIDREVPDFDMLENIISVKLDR